MDQRIHKMQLQHLMHRTSNSTMKLLLPVITFLASLSTAQGFSVALSKLHSLSASRMTSFGPLGVCTSGRVETVADNTKKAADQIKKLQDMLNQQDSEFQAAFQKKIDKSYLDAKITDARLLTENMDIKTEYSSEFSLDKIAAVVTSALKTVAAVKNSKNPAPYTSEEAIAAYTDTVNSVAEAAKSSSTSASSLSYSFTRVSPGTFALLYASSVSIKDEDTFGTEAVTSTAIYYRLVESLDALKSETAFNEAAIDAANLINLKLIQAALTDGLASGMLTIDEWSAKDAAMSAAVERVQKRLDSAAFTTLLAKPKKEDLAPSEAEKVVKESILILEAKGAEFEDVVKVSASRLEQRYFK